MHENLTEKCFSFRTTIGQRIKSFDTDCLVVHINCLCCVVLRCGILVDSLVLSSAWINFQIPFASLSISFRFITYFQRTIWFWWFGDLVIWLLHKYTQCGRIWTLSVGIVQTGVYFALKVCFWTPFQFSKHVHLPLAHWFSSVFFLLLLPQFPLIVLHIFHRLLSYFCI